MHALQTVACVPPPACSRDSRVRDFKVSRLSVSLFRLFFIRLSFRLRGSLFSLPSTALETRPSLLPGGQALRDQEVPLFVPVEVEPDRLPSLVVDLVDLEETCAVGRRLGGLERAAAADPLVVDGLPCRTQEGVQETIDPAGALLEAAADPNRRLLGEPVPGVFGPLFENRHAGPLPHRLVQRQALRKAG